MYIFFFSPKKSLLLSSFSLASTRSIFVSINKARDEIWCHSYNKCICDNREDSNAFQDPIPDSCSTRRVCQLQEKWAPKCLRYCTLWSTCPHHLKSFYVVSIQESLSKNNFSYWTTGTQWTCSHWVGIVHNSCTAGQHVPIGIKIFMACQCYTMAHSP